jgi:ribosomal protein S18 acetylase RimI-like enzyme
LLETACNWAKSRGAETAKLAVVAANTSAVKCYERCGFTVYGTEPRVIRHEGVDYDEYLMLRPLGSS